MQNFGRILITAGIILTLSGVIVYFAGNKLSWFGRLPGDIRIEKENFVFYFPVTTMILISIVITGIIWIIKKIF
jgi:hypothetical protein